MFPRQIKDIKLYLKIIFTEILILTSSATFLIYIRFNRNSALFTNKLLVINYQNAPVKVNMRTAGKGLINALP